MPSQRRSSSRIRSSAVKKIQQRFRNKQENKDQKQVNKFRQELEVIKVGN